MRLRCAKCDRPLTRFAVQIPTRAGPMGWGPTCAKSVVIKSEKRKQARLDLVSRRGGRRQDLRQRDLFKDLD